MGIQADKRACARLLIWQSNATILGLLTRNGSEMECPNAAEPPRAYSRSLSIRDPQLSGSSRQGPGRTTSSRRRVAWRAWIPRREVLGRYVLAQPGSDELE